MINVIPSYITQDNFYNDTTIISTDETLRPYNELQNLCLIDSQAKNNFVKSLLKDDKTYLIQGTRFELDDGDNFYDNNGNELTYFDWDTNEPNLFYYNNAIIINKNQKWATIEYNEKHGAILEYNIKRLSDYFQNPRIYYQVFGIQEVT